MNATTTLHFNSNHALPYYLLLLILLFTPTATAQIPNNLSPPPPDNRISGGIQFDKSMGIVLIILVFVFLILGFLSVYTRRCAQRRITGRVDFAIPITGSHHQLLRGLDPEIIQTFPTFIYSTVKALKIGMATLECAVCLNEFEDNETLRLIPICSHVFHPECIDAWLANHSTCPVCRSNLLPKPGGGGGGGESTSISILIPDPQRSDSDDPIQLPASSRSTTNSPKGDCSITPNRIPSRPVRSRSTSGFRIADWFPFPRSHSTGHSLVLAGENYERFTLRLPEEVRNRLVSSMLTPTTTGGVVFTREGSGRRSYRTRSVGSSALVGRGFNWTPPFMGRVGSNRSKKGGGSLESNKGTMDDVGERSSDCLFAGNRDN